MPAVLCMVLFVREYALNIFWKIEEAIIRRTQCKDTFLVSTNNAYLYAMPPRGVQTKEADGQ